MPEHSCLSFVDRWVGARCVCFAVEGDPTISLALVYPWALTHPWVVGWLNNLDFVFFIIKDSSPIPDPVPLPATVCVIKNQTQNWASLALAIFRTSDHGTWNRAALDLAMFKEFWWWYLETRPKTIPGTGPVWIRFCILLWPSFLTSGNGTWKTRPRTSPGTGQVPWTGRLRFRAVISFFGGEFPPFLAKFNGKGKRCHKFSDFLFKKLKKWIKLPKKIATTATTWKGA